MFLSSMVVFPNGCFVLTGTIAVIAKMKSLKLLFWNHESVFFCWIRSTSLWLDLITIKQLYKLFKNTEFLLSFKQECLIKGREQRKKINQINSSKPYGRRFQDLFNYKGHETNPKSFLSPLWKASTTLPETRQSLPGQHQKIFFWSKQRLQEHWEIVTTVIK